MPRHFLIPLVIALAVSSIYWWQKEPTAADVQYSKLTTAEFIEQHWQKPLAPQGQPPQHFSELEASLSPHSCGQCHQQQYQDWQISLHSKTLGPGILWQLHLLSQEEANSCLDCHTPLAEQKAVLAKQFGWPNAPQARVPDYVGNQLADDGLICAACHLRSHQRFGPLPQQESSKTIANTLPHDGFVASAAFADSQFCATCHQFKEEGGRTAGKLRENTYQEWLASPYAEQGVHCQDCHMPNRRHHWRGIHSPTMTEQAVTGKLWLENGQVKASITNTGAGHLFPTYMIPKVYLSIELVNGQHRRSLAQATIGWQVELDLQTEQFDTRLAPNQSLFFQANQPNQYERIELVMTVQPDEHYRRLYEDARKYQEQLGDAGSYLLEQAIDNTKKTSFSLVLAEVLAELE